MDGVETRSQKLAELRQSIQIGIDQARHAQVSRFDEATLVEAASRERERFRRRNGDESSAQGD